MQKRARGGGGAVAAAKKDALSLVMVPLVETLRFVSPSALGRLQCCSKAWREAAGGRPPVVHFYQLTAGYRDFTFFDGENYGPFWPAYCTWNSQYDSAAQTKKKVDDEEEASGCCFYKTGGVGAACGGRLSLTVLPDQTKPYKYSGLMTLGVTLCAPALAEACRGVVGALHSQGLLQETVEDLPRALASSSCNNNSPVVKFDADKLRPGRKILTKLPRAVDHIPRRLLLDIAGLAQSNTAACSSSVGGERFCWVNDLAELPADAVPTTGQQQPRRSPRLSEPPYSRREAEDAILSTLRITEFTYAHPNQRKDLPFDYYFVEHVLKSPGSGEQPGRSVLSDATLRALDHKHSQHTSLRKKQKTNDASSSPPKEGEEPEEETTGGDRCLCNYCSKVQDHNFASDSESDDY